MEELKVGDIVARKSHGLDILFKVIDFIKHNDQNVAILKGICYRIEADAPEEDLIIQTDQEIHRHNMNMSRILDRKLGSIRAAGLGIQSKSNV